MVIILVYFLLCIKYGSLLYYYIFILREEGSLYYVYFFFGILLYKGKYNDICGGKKYNFVFSFEYDREDCEGSIII